MCASFGLIGPCLEKIINARFETIKDSELISIEYLLQILETKGLMCKQIKRDNLNLYRLISILVYENEESYENIMNRYLNYMNQNQNNLVFSSILKKYTDCDVGTYINHIKLFSSMKEFDLILLCMIFKFNLILFYFNNALKNIYLDLQFPKTYNAFIDNQGYYHFLTEMATDLQNNNLIPSFNAMNMNFDELNKQSIQDQQMMLQELVPNMNGLSNVLQQTIGEKDSGKLKFFNMFQKFGFFVSDKDGSDVFFHIDDAIKNGITAEFLQMTQFNPNIRFSYQIMYYYGKHKLSRKAINIQALLIQ